MKPHKGHATFQKRGKEASGRLIDFVSTFTGNRSYFCIAVRKPEAEDDERGKQKNSRTIH